MKTNKHLTLKFIKKKESVRGGDIADQFDYSPDTARSYLSYLAKQDIIERGGSGYSITDKGTDRLNYFDVAGCKNFDCPICQNKKAGHITCPHCDYDIPIKNARIKPENTVLLFFTDEAGVYCPKCKELALSEKMALLMGIRKDT
jgi:predicted transcriptional regulator